MELNLFNNSNDGVKASLQNTDAEKFQKIFGILCAKRKALEEKTRNLEENLNLRQLIESMKTFGITELDYQKWLVLEAKSGH